MNDPVAGRVDAGKNETLGVKRPVTALALFSLSIALLVLVYLFLLSVFRGTGLSCVPALILAAGCLATNLVFLRADRLTLGSMGCASTSGLLRKIILGFLSGTVLVVGWMLIVILLLRPQLHFHSPASSAAVANLIAFYFFNNAAEELAYRGYAFLRLEENYSRAIAISLTSAVFTLLHIQGGMAWVNALAGVFTSALLLAALFASSRSLPLTLGFHCATNVAQDVFGLRQTPLSLASLDYVRPVTSAGANGALLAVAILNLSVFVMLLRRAQKK